MRNRSSIAWIAAACVMSGAIAASFASSGKPDALRTSTLEIVDEEGRVRATLGLNEKNEPSLRLLDSRGTVRATLALFDRGEPGPGDDGVGTFLSLTGANAEDGVTVSAQSNVRAIWLNDFEGAPRMELKVGQYGAPQLLRPSIAINDAEGEARLELGLSPMSTARPADRRTKQAPGPDVSVDPSPYLVLHGAPRSPIASLRGWSKGAVSFDLWDSGQASLLELPAKPQDPAAPME